MSERNAARRYAKALLEIAVDESKVDDLAGELQRVRTALESDGGSLLDALGNPVVTSDERHGIVQALLPHVQVGPIATNLLRLVADRGRFGIFAHIVDAYQEMVDEREGRVRVEVTTVEPLTPQLESDIRTAFEQSTGKSVVLDARIDSSLIGGLVARVGSKVYDASIRSRLEDIKHRLIDAQAIAEA